MERARERKREEGEIPGEEEEEGGGMEQEMMIAPPPGTKTRRQQQISTGSRCVTKDWGGKSEL